MNAKMRMYQRIEAHGKKLIQYFNLPADTDPIALCKKLFQCENKAHRIARDSCNGYIQAPEEDKLMDAVRRRIDKIIPGLTSNPLFFINWDPRGYSLKLKSEAENCPLPTDWGGYYLIAPDLTEE